MKVLLAEHLGFCFGVERAVQLAEEAAAQGVVCTLGPLIHNRRVVERLEAAGVRWVSGLDEAKGAVILRTHGVGPAVYEGARRRGLEVVDATCPFVRRAREEAAHLQAEGYQVVVVGDARHPEVLALQEWLQGKAWVVADRQEARQLPASARVGVVAQTTV
ncbi:MAG TPA: 4-hydroxy-3-methylbut-2-enyl diphosphate reductase, partial [Firmicutes bacterium]|nr:4-hydroxy-3-methylbut-2-enyl diphosphate reductase [Bacillota bacterium]